MHVPFQLRVPIDHAKSLDEKLKEVIAAHEQEVAQFQRKIKVTPHSEKLFSENARLIDRKKKLTANHLLRAALALGVSALSKLDPDKVLSKLDEDVIVRGRPRGR